MHVSCDVFAEMKSEMKVSGSKDSVKEFTSYEMGRGSSEENTKKKKKQRLKKNDRFCNDFDT